MEWLSPRNLTRLIESLDDDRFADLGNALLSEVAAQNGIDRSCLATNLRVKEGDGGIDARCVDAPITVGRLFPRQSTDYQFKGGRQNRSARKIIEDDILVKPRVIDGLRRGHAFVYLAAWDRSDKIEEELLRILREEVARRRDDERLADLTVEDGQLIFIGGDTIARILAAFPGLVARFVGFDIPVLSLEQWAAFRSLRNPYQINADLETKLRTLQAQIAAVGSRTRLVGAAGDGKTRMALEALRGSDLSDTVVYAPQPGDLTAAFVAHLARTRDIRCIVVIDEVDDATAANLDDRFSAMPPGIRLITIGLDGARRPRPDTFVVEGLDEELLIAAIMAIVPSLPLEVARSVARDCERSPKLAVLIANRLREDPLLVAPAQRLADRVVWGALDRYLNIQPDSPGWQALSIAALLTRVGWLDEVEAESEALFRAVGIDPIMARLQLDDLHDRFGIAPLAGRYRYVSPAILADHLAARQLDAWTRSRVSGVLGAMTRPMADSFAQRVRRMAGALKNRRVIEEVVLGDQGPFRTLADLEDGGIGPILRRFAAPFPRATLAAIRRISASASLDELRAATRSRRDLVWALEELLWREDTFEGAADLLLRLAIAENETWSNNASGMWVETFQMRLGRTAAGAEARASVLRRAAGSVEPAARRLAAEAIGAGLVSGQLSRAGMPPEELEGGPIKEWQPTTYGEWRDAVVAFLGILTPLLQDSDAAVQQAAAKALGAGAEIALKLPGAIEVWATTARGLIGADYAARTPVLEAIDRAQKRWGRRIATTNAEEGESNSGESRVDSLEQERLAVIAAVATVLRGQDFSSRFRDALTRSPRLAMEATVQGNAEQDAIRRMERLAAEALETPALLEAEAEWLLSSDIWRPVEWFGVLGQFDRSRVFEPLLRELVSRSPQAILWASLYDLAYSRVVKDADFIDRRVTELRASGAPSGQAFDLLMRAGYSPARLVQVLELLKAGTISAAAINVLAYAPWGDTVPTAKALQLAQSAVERANEPEDILPFVANYLMQVAAAVPEFRELSLRVLAAVPTSTVSRDALDEWAWARLALLYVDEVPERIAAAALGQLASGLRWGDEIREVLDRTWEIGDKIRLFEDVWAPWLEASGTKEWLVRNKLSGFPLSDIDVEVPMTWVALDPERRVAKLAEIIGAPSDRPSELHAALLERYGEEVGGIFYGALLTGTWMGPVSAWFREKLERARRWLADERPPVRDWARQMVRVIEEEVREADAREAEERFRL